MALPKMSARADGWQSQTDYLTQTHTAVGMAMMAVADRARRRPSALPEIIDSECEVAASAGLPAHAGRPICASVPACADEPEPLSASPTDLEQQLVRKSAAIRILSKHTNALSEQAAAAERRAAELEAELSLAQEAIDLRTNENFSFQNSFDLIVAENGRLSSRLAENAATLDKAAAEIERLQAALHAANAERDNLRLAAEQARGKHQAEIDMLQARAAALSSRAATAEALLVEAQQNLLAHSQANSRVETEVSRLYDRATRCRSEVDRAQAQLDKTNAALRASETERRKLAAAHEEAERRHAVEIEALNSRLDVMSRGASAAEKMFAQVRQSLLEKAEQLQNALNAKDQQIQELEHSRTQLVDGTNMLLKTFSSRDMALARAEQTIKRLMVRIAGLEAEAKLANNQELIEKLKRLLQGEGAALPVIVDARNKPNTDNCDLCVLPAHRIEPTDCASAPQQKSSAEILYANTITF